jgi:hypothetical protein
MPTRKLWRLVAFPMLTASNGDARHRVGDAGPTAERLTTGSPHPMPLHPMPLHPMLGRLYDLKGTQEARRVGDGASVGKDDDLGEQLVGCHIREWPLESSFRCSFWAVLSFRTWCEYTDEVEFSSGPLASLLLLCPPCRSPRWVCRANCVPSFLYLLVSGMLARRRGGLQAATRSSGGGRAGGG